MPAVSAPAYSSEDVTLDTCEFACDSSDGDEEGAMLAGRFCFPEQFGNPYVSRNSTRSPLNRRRRAEEAGERLQRLVAKVQMGRPGELPAGPMTHRDASVGAAMTDARSSSSNRSSSIPKNLKMDGFGKFRSQPAEIDEIPREGTLPSADNRGLALGLGASGGSGGGGGGG
eukprot:CAMPEP_0183412204 /NCGR_PEP_ID=MMETSP0370-20130417/20856_1 /TAXON_ID=268820 /ORGANISM="Peridinium aciculiferum, Strain PAER-2" /LENGTH=170 /DNA_ID=CAMNT_0025595281 /DNA_START=41 /DNA_END=549 /DNA_ORIENTATION=-